MPDRQFKERRRNIGGISKETYVELHLSGDREKVAAADYDMLESVKDCVSQTIADLCAQCANRPLLCDTKYIRKAHPKVPLSWLGIVGMIILITLGVDAGILHGKMIKAIVDFFT